MEIPMPNEWISGDELLQQIKVTSKKRRRNPQEFFCDFLSGIWKDNTDEEAMVQWKVKVEQFPWYADDAIYCMEEIISNPPKNLIELLKKHGWIYLYHEEILPDEPEYTDEEYIQWVKNMYASYKRIYEKFPKHN